MRKLQYPTDFSLGQMALGPYFTGSTNYNHPGYEGVQVYSLISEYQKSRTPIMTRRSTLTTQRLDYLAARWFS